MMEVPGIMEVTTPPDDTVATAVLLLTHEPPAAVLLRDMVPPSHTAPAPIMDDGTGNTITVTLAQEPGVVQPPSPRT